MRGNACGQDGNSMLMRLLHAALIACASLLAGCDPAAEDDPDAPLNISANISGLQGTLVLFNSGFGVIGVTGSGNVNIATHVLAGSPYNVTIARQPFGQTCTISNGSGIANSEMTAVLISCGRGDLPGGVLRQRAGGRPLTHQQRGRRLDRLG
jgi:hypothetical protein